MTPSPGTTPDDSFIIDISVAISSLMSLATDFPSIILADASVTTEAAEDFH